MDMLKYIKYVLLLIVAVFILASYSCVDSEAEYLRDGTFCFSFTGISWGGDWSHYKNTMEIDRLNVNVTTDPIMGNTPIDLLVKLKYGGDNKPYVEGSLYESANYILDCKPGYRVSTPLIVNSTFFSTTPGKTDTEKAKYDHEMHNQTDNDLRLHYNADIRSGISLRVEVEKTDWTGWVSDAYQYNVHYDIVHKASSNDGNKNGSINIVVMAEGYRADQIDQYVEYVNDAFKDSASFHYLGWYDTDAEYKHIDNEFFYEYWNRINVIRMDTISPQDGIDENNGMDNVKTILKMSVRDIYNSNRGGVPDFYRIKSIMERTKPNGMSYTDVDAYVILVNHPTIWAYTWSYGNEICKRGGEPVRPIIIQAPVHKQNGTRFNVKTDEEYEFHNHNPYSAEKHSGVKTDAIAHELGHAIGRLQDEYIDKKKSSGSYESKHRNISGSVVYPNPLKWGNLKKLGYDTSPRYPLGTYKGALYTENYYRPTNISTMRGRYTDESIDENNQKITIYPQFGPVNTYIMAASFHDRLINRSKTSDHTCTDSPSSYEWPDYSFSRFLKEWPPSKF